MKFLVKNYIFSKNESASNFANPLYALNMLCSWQNGILWLLRMATTRRISDTVTGEIGINSVTSLTKAGTTLTGRLA